MDISTLHKDGWRLVDRELTDGRRVVEFWLLVGGDTVATVGLTTLPADASQPVRERYCKLGESIARFANEGGDLEDAIYMVQKLQEEGVSLTASLELASITYEEKHERVYFAPDGNYVRVVEDEFSEVLTPQEMSKVYCGSSDAARSPYEELIDGQEIGEEEGGEEVGEAQEGREAEEVGEAQEDQEGEGQEGEG